MEPVTVVGIAAILWDYLGQPILDSAKSKFGDKVLLGLSKGLPFEKNNNEIIEAEIIKAVNNKMITSEDSLLIFLEHNHTFIQALVELNKTKSFQEIINSFKDINKSNIKINGDDKKVVDSFTNISESVIDI